MNIDPTVQKIFLVEIVSCRTSGYWYSDKIGTILFVTQEPLDLNYWFMVKVKSDDEHKQFWQSGLLLDPRDLKFI